MNEGTMDDKEEEERLPFNYRGCGLLMRHGTGMTACHAGPSYPSPWRSPSHPNPSPSPCQSPFQASQIRCGPPACQPHGGSLWPPGSPVPAKLGVSGVAQSPGRWRVLTAVEFGKPRAGCGLGMALDGTWMARNASSGQG